jgi:hypothetical protein
MRISSARSGHGGTRGPCSFSQVSSLGRFARAPTAGCLSVAPSTPCQTSSRSSPARCFGPPFAVHPRGQGPRRRAGRGGGPDAEYEESLNHHCVAPRFFSLLLIKCYNQYPYIAMSPLKHICKSPVKSQLLSSSNKLLESLETTKDDRSVV